MSDEQEEIICEECGEEKATIHLTDFGEAGPHQVHLCEGCYNRREDLPALSQSKIVEQLIEAIAPELQKLGLETCPECGMSYLEFRQSFRLGCPQDYEVFEEPLDQILAEIQASTHHVGKVPRGAAQLDSGDVLMEILQRELEESVQQEDFVRAAELRDEIRELEQDRAGRPQ